MQKESRQKEEQTKQEQCASQQRTEFEDGRIIGNLRIANGNVCALLHAIDNTRRVESGRFALPCRLMHDTPLRIDFGWVHEEQL